MDIVYAEEGREDATGRLAKTGSSSAMAGQKMTSNL